MNTATPTAAQIVPVRIPGAVYNVEIGTQLLPGIGERLNALLQGRLTNGKLRTFVVTSPELAALWAGPLLDGFPHCPVVLHVPAGEAHKRLPTVERLAEELSSHGADRDSVLLALGGGVIGDLTGFLAAIYMRGIPYVQVPTTLLAQVDSSVGGKTGANLAAGKNLVGAFHHPLAVYADITTLRTLPAAELRAGLQEAVKSAIIRDPDLFDFLEREGESVRHGDPEALQHVVAACVRIKAEVVEADEREGNLRMILNLGHTLGHAIEAATHYTQLLHGEAVAWGMLASLEIAQRRATVTPAEADRISHLIRAYGPLRTFSATAEQLVNLTARDKKNRSGTRSFVLPVGIGDATVVHEVTDGELTQAAAVVCREAATL
ncbi:MAG TPA: 3-dehydroquinate synthase [Acidobacteriaceae bacterium]|nr:3-dehydroquinate synthase [Acidobacteriaceae bacterium]